MDANAEMPFWRALLFDRGQRSGASTMGILVRWMIPLVGVVALGWPAQPFLLAAVVNFAWNWVLVGAWNTSTTAATHARLSGTPVTAGKRIGMIATGAVVLILVTCGFGFPVFFLWPSRPVLDFSWWTSIALTLLTPLPNLVEQIRRDAMKGMSDDQIDALADQRRQLLFVSIIPIVGAYGVLAKFPSPAVLIAVAVVYVLFSALCELRPDLAAEFAKELPK